MCKTSTFHREGILAQQIDGIYKLFNIVTDARERVGLTLALRKIKRKAKAVKKQLPPTNSTIQLNRHEDKENQRPNSFQDTNQSL